MSENIRLSSGIVIDRESKKAYFMAPEGGISAINLQNGETLWHTKNADKPLLIQDNLLVAQAISPENVEGVTIHMLQTDSDGELVNKGLIPVPSGVNPVVSPTLEHSFSISASNSPVGAVLQWTARERPLHGLPPVQMRCCRKNGRRWRV